MRPDGLQQMITQLSSVADGIDGFHTHPELNNFYAYLVVSSRAGHQGGFDVEVFASQLNAAPGRNRVIS